MENENLRQMFSYLPYTLINVSVFYRGMECQYKYMGNDQIENTDLFSLREKGSEVERAEILKNNKPLDRGPYFDTSATKNVTSLVGKTAHLNCRIKNLGNKTVSI